EASNVCASSRTWFCTPPATTKEYGQTIPIRISCSTHLAGYPGSLVTAGPSPHLLHHVPVRRVGGDVAREHVGERLRGRRDFGTRVHPDPGVDAQSPSRVRVPTTHRQQCGTRARRQPCGPGGKPRGCPEEVDVHARRGQFAISD